MQTIGVSRVTVPQAMRRDVGALRMTSYIDDNDLD